MKIKTSELSGVALDWAVAMAEGDRVFRPRVARPSDWDRAAFMENGSDDRWCVKAQVPDVGWYADYSYNPSSCWLYGGPIIDREMRELGFDLWRPRASADFFATYERGLPDSYVSGPTPLIAAMRCYVSSKCGDKVDIPEELLK